MIEVQSRTSCEDLIKEKDKEIEKLVDELEEQERHIKDANAEIERQKEVINGMIDNEEKYLLEINKLKSIIKEVRELVENGTDFKCITFRKADEDTWKLILASHIKENFLDILDKENK